jgi:hypothetical protein
MATQFRRTGPSGVGCALGTKATCTGNHFSLQPSNRKAFFDRMDTKDEVRIDSSEGISSRESARSAGFFAGDRRCVPYPACASGRCPGSAPPFQRHRCRPLPALHCHAHGGAYGRGCDRYRSRAIGNLRSVSGAHPDRPATLLPDFHSPSPDLLLGHLSRFIQYFASPPPHVDRAMPRRTPNMKRTDAPPML